MSRVPFQDLSDRARNSPESGISAVVNHAREMDGLIPLWVGEGDLPTPDFIRQAGIAALENGETFYTWQRGIPPLRQALANYHARHFNQSFEPEEFLVTGSGMQSIQLVLQAVTSPGDEVLYLAPAWPNFAAAAAIAGTAPVAVGLDFGDNGWSFDPGRLSNMHSPRTKALFINSPSNPTGWTADIETLRAILAFARAHGLWIIADEIYTHFHYSGSRAPSFIDIMEPHDRILFVNSFSKNWAMTGWRVGWIRGPASLAPVFENLIQYSTSGVAQFMQKAAVAALDGGDIFISDQVTRARQARDIISSRLQKTGRVRLSSPPGAFYLFFAIDGITDTRQAAIDIVNSTGVGLAPGTAFGPGGENFLRLCFNRRIEDVEEAASRLEAWLA